MEKYIIRKGNTEDIDELEKLYDSLNDYLEENINYPGWRKGLYPIRKDAAYGIENETLYVMEINGRIAGTENNYDDILVIRTFAVHPDFMKGRVGSSLMKFAEKFGRENGIKSIRLDVAIQNIPAISLYEKLGYKYIDIVDLGLNIPWLKWFKLYELVL